MKKKIFSIVTAVMVCLPFAMSAVAYDGGKNINTDGCDHIYETITPMSFPCPLIHNWRDWVVHPNIWINDSSYCGGGYMLHLYRTRSCIRCGAAQSEWIPDPNAQKHVWIQNLCRNCGAIR
jgi:hypothetical protein